MNSIRNKKLLACFLTALGLSANSLNTSAKNSQFMSNMKFELNKITASQIFGGKKIEEKVALDNILKESNELYKLAEGDSMIDSISENDAYDRFFDLCNRLYSKLLEMYRHRCDKNYDSLLKKSLGEILKFYPSENISYVCMKEWLFKITGDENRPNEYPGIKWGNFSVGSTIKKIAELLEYYNIGNLVKSAENRKAKAKEKEDISVKEENSNDSLVNIVNTTNVKEKNEEVQQKTKEEVKQETTEEKINRTIKNRFKIITYAGQNHNENNKMVYNFKLKDNKFKEFKEKIEDVDLKSGIITMQSITDYQNLVGISLSEDDISLTEYGHISGYSLDNTDFAKYKLSRGHLGSTLMIQALVKELNQEVNNYNRGKKDMQFTVVNIGNENESFVNIEIP